MGNQQKQVKSMKTTERKSAFKELGFKKAIEALKAEIQDLYKSDDVPWIIGYSGGKDSTATLQLVWLAIQDLPESERHKTIHVISTDTLVENPVVAAWVMKSLDHMQSAASTMRLPIRTHRLTPEVSESFWVNLLGKGYPAPRLQLRWCTERLKIRPSNRFISGVVKEHGSAILLLGARSAESSARAARMQNYKGQHNELLTENATLPNCYIYAPIRWWENDDVWQFLLREQNPWGHSNKELMSMYAGATEGGECPVVVDTSTPSCGSSRFGCWVCTVVDQDKSMAAMVQNDQDLEWLMPLLSFRNMIDPRGRTADGRRSGMRDRPLRDFRRMTGYVALNRNASGAIVPGPLKQSTREHWLGKLLVCQLEMRERAPDTLNTIDIITLPELEEIRRIWVLEKHELEDSLPRIYEEATGTTYPGQPLDDAMVLGAEDMEDLNELCGDDRLHYELARELLSLERQERATGRRAKLYDKLEKSFRKHFYDDEQDATHYAQTRAKRRHVAETKATGTYATKGAVK